MAMEAVEYKDMMARTALFPFYREGYSDFGWVLFSFSDTMDVQRKERGHIRFKCKRPAHEKTELVRLRKHFEFCAGEIDALERRKEETPFSVARLEPLLREKRVELQAVCDRARDILEQIPA